MLPKQLIIGGVPYLVREGTERDMQDGALLGDIVYSQADLRVANWIAPDKKLAVLWHEIVHGLLVEADIERHFGEEGPDKEEVIQHLSKILRRFVQDNDLSWEVQNWKKQ